MKNNAIKILLVSLALLSTYALIAQNSDFHFPTLKEKIEQHEITVEAIILDIDTVIDSTYLHTLYTLQVYKMLKGESTQRIVARLAELKVVPIFEDSHAKDNNIPKLHIGYQGLFLINDYPPIAPNGVSYYIDDAIIYPNQIYYDLGKSSAIPDYQFRQIEGKPTYSAFINSLSSHGITYQEVSSITFNPFVAPEKPNPFAVDSVTKAERERLEQIEEEYIIKKIEEQKQKKMRNNH